MMMTTTNSEAKDTTHENAVDSVPRITLMSREELTKFLEKRFRDEDSPLRDVAMNRFWTTMSMKSTIEAVKSHIFDTSKHVVMTVMYKKDLEGEDIVKYEDVFASKLMMVNSPRTTTRKSTGGVAPRIEFTVVNKFGKRLELFNRDVKWLNDLELRTKDAEEEAALVAEMKKIVMAHKPTENDEWDDEYDNPGTWKLAYEDMHDETDETDEVASKPSFPENNGSKDKMEDDGNVQMTVDKTDRRHEELSELLKAEKLSRTKAEVRVTFLEYSVKCLEDELVKTKGRLCDAEESLVGLTKTNKMLEHNYKKN